MRLMTMTMIDDDYGDEDDDYGPDMDTPMRPQMHGMRTLGTHA